MTKRSTLRALLPVAAIAAGAIACTPPSQYTPLTTGDLAFEIHIHDGEMEPHITNLTAGITYDHDQAVVEVPEAAETTISGDPGYAFLGASGDPVWVLPQSPAGGPTPRLGFDGEEVGAGVLIDDTVHATLVAVDGPGAVHFYSTEDEVGDPLPAPEVHFDSDDPGADEFEFTTAEDVFGAWAFTAPGKYVITLQTEGDLVGGGTIESAPTRFIIRVG